MLKKKTLSKIFKSALIFLTLSAFVVSCGNNSLVPEEPEEGGTELGEETGEESGNEGETTIPAPTGVTVTADTEPNTVIIKWTPNGSECYRIYYNSSNNTQTATLINANAQASDAENGYKHKLTSSGTYYFWVKAAKGTSDTSETSDFSTVVSYNFTYTALPAPEGLNVAAGSKTNTVSVTWTSNDSQNYWIYYNTTDDSSTATCATKYAYSYQASSGYQISLPSTGKYYFWIKSATGYSDTAETSDFSSVVSYDFTYTPLSAPTGLTVETNDDSNSVKLKWTDNNSCYYWLYYNTENDSSTATRATKSAYYYNASTGYTITLPLSGTYYFWVKSADGTTETSGTSDFSNPVTYFFTNTRPIPTGLTVEESDKRNFVNIKWTDIGSSYYWIYYNDKNDTSTATCVTKNAKASDATAGYSTSLTKSGTYYFWIRGADYSFDTDSVSDFSSTVTYSFINSLTAPEDFLVTSGNKTNTVKISWTSNNSDLYYIYYNNANDPEGENCKKVREYSSSTSHTLSLNSNGTYYFWIKSVVRESGSYIESDFSSPIEYDFVYTVPVPPSVVTIEPYDYLNYIKITWNDTNYSYYRIYYNTTNDTESAECIDKSVLSSYATNGYKYLLKSTGTYYFWVKSAEDYSDDSATSDFSPVTAYNFTYTEPSAPTGVKAFTKYEPDEVRIIWNKNNFRYYWIYYNTVNDTSTATCVTTSAIAYSDVGNYSLSLPSKEIYYLWIKAADDSTDTSKTSDFSLACSVDNSQPKEAPTGLKAVKGKSSDYVTLTWDDNGSSYYWIYYSKTNNPSTATAVSTGATSVTASFGYSKYLSEYGTYYFWVKGADTNGISSSSYSSDFSSVATYEYSLNPPTGLSVRDGTNTNEVKIKWFANGSPFYWIYYNTKNDTQTATLATQYVTSSDSSSGYNLLLPVSGTYYFWVKSANGYNNDSLTSDFSSPVTYEFTNTIEVPTGFTCEYLNTSGKVKVKWTPNDNYYYWVYYNTIEDPATATCAIYDLTASYATKGYTISLPSSGVYYLWIRGSNGYFKSSSAASDFSESVRFDSAKRKDPPTGLTVEAGSEESSVKVKWNDNESNYYWVYYNTTNDPASASATVKKITNSGNSVYEYECSLSLSGTYYFWIRGADYNHTESSASDFSSVVSYDYTNLMAVPTGISVQSGDKMNSVKIKWTSTSASYYWLYYNTTNDPSSATVVTRALSSSNSSTGYNCILPSTGTYYFWIRAAKGYYEDSIASDFSAGEVKYNFTRTNLYPPTGITIEEDSSKNNGVIVKWTDNGSNYYWIYYNNKNDSSTASCKTTFGDKFYSTNGYSFVLPTNGVYYFWIRSADSAFDDNSEPSAFSDPVQFTVY